MRLMLALLTKRRHYREHRLSRIDDILTAETVQVHARNRCPDYIRDSKISYYFNIARVPVFIQSFLCDAIAIIISKKHFAEISTFSVAKIVYFTRAVYVLYNDLRCILATRIAFSSLYSHNVSMHCERDNECGTIISTTVTTIIYIRY